MILQLLSLTTGVAADGVPAAVESMDGLTTDLDFAGALLRMLVTLVGLLLVAVLLLLAARRLGLARPVLGSARGGRMRVLESLRLEPRKTLYLVLAGDREFLIVSAGESVDVLASGPFGRGATPTDHESPTEAPGPIAAILRRGPARARHAPGSQPAQRGEETT